MAEPPACREATKYRLLRRLFTTPVSTFCFSGESFICGELFLLREALDDLRILADFVQILVDMDLVGSYMLDDSKWRLIEVKPDGDIASMQCTGAATMGGESIDVDQVKSLILRTDWTAFIQDQKTNFFETRELTDDDADLDNCKFVSIYVTVPCVLIARTSLML